MIVIDLCVDQTYRHLLNKTKEIIEKTNDELKENYLDINLDEFISFPVVIINNEIVCFSGAQLKPEIWGDNIARFSTRFWRHPDYRIKSLWRLENLNLSYNIKYCVPIQLQKIKNLGINTFFISRESKHAGSVYKTLYQYTQTINKFYNTNLEILSNFYNVCGNIRGRPQCVQFVAVHSTDESKKIWHENMHKYIRRPIAF